MNSVAKIALGGLLGVTLIGAAPSAALAQGSDRGTVFELAKTDSKGDYTIARARAMTKIIDRCLDGWSHSIIQGEARKKAIHALFDILGNDPGRKPKMRKMRSGKVKYTWKYKKSQVRDRLMDILEVGSAYGQDPFITVAVNKDWFTGGKLSQDEVLAIWRGVTAGCSNKMTDLQWQESPAADNREKVARAAIEMGASPTTGKLHTFAELYQASYVLTIKGQIKFTRSNARGGGFIGYLRPMGIVARVFDKDTRTILAKFPLGGDAESDELGDVDQTSDPPVVHQPWVGSDPGQLSEVAERYAQEIGTIIANKVTAKVMKQFFARQAAAMPKPVVVAKPRDCPGCGDRIIDGKVMECPACESELPKAEVTTKMVGGKMPQPSRRDYFELWFKGFDDDEIGEVIDLLRENKYFPKKYFKHQGTKGKYTTWKCAYVGHHMGEGVCSEAIKEALLEGDLADSVKVEVNGNRIKMKKKGS